MKSNKTASSFSQKNTSVFVTAPGENLVGLGYTNSNAYVQGEAGTSFSTAFVTAMAALAKSEDKDISTETFKTLLIKSSEDLGDPGYDTTFGYGFINLSSFADELTREYSILYGLNGGSFLPEQIKPETYTVKSNNIVLPVPVWAGYDFAGWFDSEDFSGNEITEISAGSVGDRNFYAKWRDASGTDIISVSVSGYKGIRMDETACS